MIFIFIRQKYSVPKPVIGMNLHVLTSHGVSRRYTNFDDCWNVGDTTSKLVNSRGMSRITLLIISFYYVLIHR